MKYALYTCNSGQYNQLPNKCINFFNNIHVLYRRTHSLHCNTLYSLHCNTLYSLHCNTLYRLHCNTLYSLHCNTLYSLHCNTLYSLHCNTLYSLHCNTLYSLHCYTLQYGTQTTVNAIAPVGTNPCKHHSVLCDSSTTKTLYICRNSFK